MALKNRGHNFDVQDRSKLEVLYYNSDFYLSFMPHSWAWKLKKEAIDEVSFRPFTPVGKGKCKGETVRYKRITIELIFIHIILRYDIWFSNNSPKTYPSTRH